MLTREEFQAKLREGICLLDGATGSNLRSAGMPRGCCTEQRVQARPVPLVAQRRGFAAGGGQVF